MIRLIASDLDETMIPEGTFDLNPEYFDVIRALKQKGILFAAASGRHYSSIKKLMKSIGNDIVCLGGNGSCVIWEGKPVMLRALPDGIYPRVLEEMRKSDPDIIMAEHADYVFTDSKNEQVFRWVHDGYRVDLVRCGDLAEIAPPILKTAMFVSNAAQQVERLRSIFKDGLNIMTAGDHWVDVVAAEVDKGSSLGLIQERFGITPAETIAFGDNGNDIGMLTLAGHSYAVANARDEVKAAADEVIGPMREDSI